ncbi:MAG: hypothetical protein HGA85_06830, partial [Nanoarchaeota archaeon]|nr:hypothetical protein [Nanoarchaeota archaeon]
RKSAASFLHTEEVEVSIIGETRLIAKGKDRFLAAILEGFTTFITPENILNDPAKSIIVERAIDGDKSGVADISNKELRIQACLGYYQDGVFDTYTLDTDLNITAAKGGSKQLFSDAEILEIARQLKKMSKLGDAKVEWVMKKDVVYILQAELVPGSAPLPNEIKQDAATGKADDDEFISLDAIDQIDITHPPEKVVVQDPIPVVEEKDEFIMVEDKPQLVHIDAKEEERSIKHLFDMHKMQLAQLVVSSDRIIIELMKDRLAKHVHEIPHDFDSIVRQLGEYEVVDLADYRLVHEAAQDFVKTGKFPGVEMISLCLDIVDKNERRY